MGRSFFFHVYIVRVKNTGYSGLRVRFVIVMVIL